MDSLGDTSTESNRPPRKPTFMAPRRACARENNACVGGVGDSELLQQGTKSTWADMPEFSACGARLLLEQASARDEVSLPITCKLWLSAG